MPRALNHRGKYDRATPAGNRPVRSALQSCSAASPHSTRSARPLGPPDNSYPRHSNHPTPRTVTLLSRSPLPHLDRFRLGLAAANISGAAGPHDYPPRSPTPDLHPTPPGLHLDCAGPPGHLDCQPAEREAAGRSRRAGRRHRSTGWVREPSIPGPIPSPLDRHRARRVRTGARTTILANPTERPCRPGKRQSPRPDKR